MTNHNNEKELFALPAGDKSSRKYTYPVIQYDHDEGKAVVGGYVYNGQAQIPGLQGKYIFGDIYNGRIFYCPVDQLSIGRQQEPLELRLVFTSSWNSLSKSEMSYLSVIQTKVYTLRADLRFGMDKEGEIYIASKQDGMIRKLVAPS